MKELQEARARFLAADRFVFAYRNHRHELDADENPEKQRSEEYGRWLDAVRAFHAGRR